MDRRAFLGALAGSLLSAPIAAKSQQAKVPKVGVLSLDSPARSACVDGLRRGLGEL